MQALRNLWLVHSLLFSMFVVALATAPQPRWGLQSVTSTEGCACAGMEILDVFARSRSQYAY